MKIAICSDEHLPIHLTLEQELRKYPHEILAFGSLQSKKETPWVEAMQEASEALRSGICEEGIFFCWSGTGAALVANKFPGIRAALCGDAETAKLARIWNHANVLALSNRLMDPTTLAEILQAWFSTRFEEKGKSGVQKISEIEKTEFRSSVNTTEMP